MNLIDIVFSTSKLAISSFITVLFVVVYETYLYIGEIRRTKKPVIPEFIPGENLPKTASPLPAHLIEKSIFNRQTFVIISAIFIFGLVSFLLEMFPSRSTQREISNSPSPTISEIRIITSSGIEIYDKNWRLLSGDRLNLKNDKEIKIAIKTIPEASIDKARIRVNSALWMTTDETSLFNDNLKLFYKNYQLTSGEKNLNIEAELHTKAEGWLN